MHIQFSFSNSGSYSIVLKFLFNTVFIYISPCQFVPNYLSVFNQHNCLMCKNWNLISYLKNICVITILGVKIVMYILRTFSWQYVSQWPISWLGLRCLVLLLKWSIPSVEEKIQLINKTIPAAEITSFSTVKHITEHQIIHSFNYTFKYLWSTKLYVKPKRLNKRPSLTSCPWGTKNSMGRHTHQCILHKV